MYCLVENGQIIQGPGRLPRNWKSISGLNLLPESRLIELGWLPLVDVKPAYDKDTQYLTSARVIGDEAVTVNYVVNDYSSEEMASRLLAAQTAKKKVIRS